MAIADTLKKAVGLFMVLPETPEAPEETTPSPPAPSQWTQSAEMSDLDKRLAEIEAKSKAIAMGPQTVAELVRQSEGPNLDEISVSAEETSGALLPDGKVDVTAIYASANLPTVAFTAEQTLQMLDKLPTSVSIDVRRQMMQVTLSTIGASMGASAETIVADASRKLAALSAYVTDLQKVTAERVQYAEAEIAALQARIEEQRGIIAATKQQVTTVQLQCEQEADRLDDILEFFSLDTGPSKYASEPGVSS